MKRGILFVFVLVFSIGFVFAVDGWDETNIDDDWGDDSDDDWGEDSDDIILDDEVAPDDTDSDDVGWGDGDSGGSSISLESIGRSAFEYTQNFYVAIGLGVFAFLIVGYLVYSFLKKPKNRWKNKR